MAAVGAAICDHEDSFPPEFVTAFFTTLVSLLLKFLLSSQDDNLHSHMN